MRTGRITRLDPAGQHHAHEAGFDWSLGDTVNAGASSTTSRRAWPRRLAAALIERPLPSDGRATLPDRPDQDFGKIDGVIVSGGVGEYVYGREHRDFGDMGRRLGSAFRKELDRMPWPLLPAGACIRATALGASEYTVQLSGNTGHVSSPGPTSASPQRSGSATDRYRWAR